MRQSTDPNKMMLFAVLICIWSIYLLPSALFSQWFTLDMGTIFTKAAASPDDVTWALAPHGGRYFPAYWLYNFFVYDLFATNIAAHFAVQAGLFVLSLSLTCFIFLKITGSFKSTLLFGVIACLGGAVAENIYTVGKAEPLAYLFIVVALLVFYTTDIERRYQALARFGIIIALVALAIWSKESSLVLLGFGPAAIVISLIVSRAADRRAHVIRHGILLLCAIVGYLISKIPFLIFPDESGSARYVDYKIDADLITNNLLFYVTQQPDVLILGVIALAVCAVIAIRLHATDNAFPRKTAVDFIFVASCLLMAWSYYAGLIIWRWPMGYYMLLPSLIFKFAAIYGLAVALKYRIFSVWYSRAAVVVVGICSVYAITHSFYVVTSQVSYSRMYTAAVSKYISESNPENRLIIESFPFYAEQISNTEQMISFVSGESRKVGGIADLLDPGVATPELLTLLNISKDQLDDNEKALPRKDDFLLVMTGDKLGTWFVRGATPYFSEDSILKKYGVYDMPLVSEAKLSSPSAFLNIWTKKPFFGSTYFGYKLYRIANGRPKIFWKGRYPDGWIGKNASIKLYSDFGERALVTVSTPSFNAPNQLTVLQDGRLIHQMTLIDGKEFSFEVPIMNAEVPVTLQFEVENTAIPKALKINRDGRELGVLVRIDPLR